MGSRLLVIKMGEVLEIILLLTSVVFFIFPKRIVTRYVTRRGGRKEREALSQKQS